MNYRHRLQYFLVKHARISNKQAAKFIEEGKVKVDNEVVRDSVILTPYSHVMLNDERISNAHLLQYIAYYKPPGVECTLNRGIAGNLFDALPQELQLISGIDVCKDNGAQNNKKRDPKFL